MMKTPIAETAIQDEDLYRNVVNHRRTFIGLRGFDYDSLYPESINIIPPSDIFELWADDYKKMQSMIYKPSPNFDELISQLSTLNHAIKSLQYKP